MSDNNVVEILKGVVGELKEMARSESIDQVKPGLHRRGDRLEQLVLVDLIDDVGALALGHVHRVRHRLDAGRVDRAQLVDQAEHPVQLADDCDFFLRAEGDAREPGKAFDLVRRERHCGAENASAAYAGGGIRVS